MNHTSLFFFHFFIVSLYIQRLDGLKLLYLKLWFHGFRIAFTAIKTSLLFYLHACGNQTRMETMLYFVENHTQFSGFFIKLVLHFLNILRIYHSCIMRNLEKNFNYPTLVFLHIIRLLNIILNIILCKFIP